MPSTRPTSPTTQPARPAPPVIASQVDPGGADLPGLPRKSLRPRMAITLGKEDRQQAIESIERYCRENMDEPTGNVAAGGLLGFLL